MEDRIAKSISDLIDIVHEQEKIFFDSDVGPSKFWYRGVSSIDYHLLPGVLREQFLSSTNDREISTGNISAHGLTLEREINRQFRRECVPFFPNELELEDTYFISQHHGLPTRLLDWTTSNLTALFFAVCDDTGESDGCVHILSPLSLIKIENPYDLGGDFLEHDQELMKLVIANLYNKNDKGLEVPLILPVLPEYRNERLRLQNSRFTLHMPSDDIMKIEEIEYAKHTRVRIPQEHKKRICVDLHRGGIHWGSLFSDLDYVTKAIKASYKL